MDNLEFDVYDYLVTAQRNGDNFDVVVTNTVSKTTIDQFTLANYKGEEDMNWDALCEEKPCRDAIIRELVAMLDSE